MLEFLHYFFPKVFARFFCATCESCEQEILWSGCLTMTRSLSMCPSCQVASLQSNINHDYGYLKVFRDETIQDLIIHMDKSKGLCEMCPSYPKCLTAQVP